MDITDGETIGGDGLPGPASRKLQGTTNQKRKAGKRKAETPKLETGPPVGQMTPDQLAATKRFLQALFKTVTVAIMLLLSGSLGTAEILHPSIHNSLLGHKTAPVQNSTRREDRGESKVEIQPEEGESKPAGGPPLVPCEAVGVGCSNRVPSGFCHFWQHLCIVAPYPDSILGLHQKLDQLLLAFEVQDAGGLADGRLGAKGEHGGLKMEDGEAHRLFALLRALELETNFRKAPVTRVFMLYCLDGLTRKIVARKCKCSPALITLRLRVIEQKLGRKPAELRQISDQFERIADSLAEPRAKRIHRPSAIDEDGMDAET